MTRADLRGRAFFWLMAFLAADAVSAQGAVLPGAAGTFFAFGLPPAKTGYAVFGRFASLPSFNAETPAAGSWHFLPELAVSQVMTSGWTGETGERTLRRYLDYEAWSLDAAFEFGLSDRFAIGADLRAGRISGGVLDGVIDFYHGLFGFEDMGRSESPRGEVVVDLATNNGFTMSLSAPTMFMADPQVHAAARIVDLGTFSATARIALNAPAGLGAGIAGTTGFQASAGLYADATLPFGIRLWSALGCVVPLESLESPGPRPMFSGRMSLVFALRPSFAPFLDLTFKGSPIESGIYDTRDGSRFDFFAAPEADLRLGFLLAPRDPRCDGYAAFALQEDPFSNNSADVGFQLVFGFRILPVREGISRAAGTGE